MAWTLVDSDAIGFSDGGSGHSFDLGGAPSAGDWDVLFVNSDATVSTPSGWTLPTGGSQVNNQGAYVFVRKAAGGEGSTVTITTGANVPAVAGWSRWRGGNNLDVTVSARIDANVGGVTPALDTGALAGTDELVVVAALLHRLASPTPSAPVWSSGYTPLTSVTEGTGTSGCTQFVGYRTDAGTAAETPSCSWTDGAFDRYAIAVTFTIDPGGPAERSASDSLTVADSAARTLTAPRGPSDTVTLSDTPTRIVSGARAAADTVTVSDAATRTATRPRTADDTTTISDAAAALLINLAAASDGITLSDTATAVVTLPRAPVDSITATDTPSRTSTVTADAADSLTVSDTAAGMLGVSRAASDTLTVSDAPARLLTLTGHTADTITLSDAAARTALALARAATDTVTVSDTATIAEPGIDITVTVGPPTRAWSAGAPWI